MENVILLLMLKTVTKTFGIPFGPHYHSYILYEGTSVTTNKLNFSKGGLSVCFIPGTGKFVDFFLTFGFV